MATFKVGQRVKLVRNVSAKNYGSEGVFVCYMDFPVGTPIIGRKLPYDTDCIVQYDSCRTPCAERTDRIEPIQPERNRIVALEDLDLPFDPRKVAEEIA